MWNLVCWETPRGARHREKSSVVQPLQCCAWLDVVTSGYQCSCPEACSAVERNPTTLGTAKPRLPFLFACAKGHKGQVAQVLIRATLCRTTSDTVECQFAEKINSARCATAHLESSAENSLGPTAPDKKSRAALEGERNPKLPALLGIFENVRNMFGHGKGGFCPMWLFTCPKRA